MEINHCDSFSIRVLCSAVRTETFRMNCILRIRCFHVIFEIILEDFVLGTLQVHLLALLHDLHGNSGLSQDTVSFCCTDRNA